MALVPYTDQSEFDLVNTGQDCRGWKVTDGSGAPLGTVKEMIIDTDAQRVSHLVLDNGTEIPSKQVSLQNGSVIVRGYAGATATETPRTDVSGTAAATAGAAAMNINDATARTLEGETTLPVIEEEIRIGKRQVESGGVRVQTHVTERPVEERVTLQEERVHVERRAVDQPLSAANAEAFKEGVVEISLMGEEVVTSKQARVVEEVVVGKEMVEHQETIRDTVRRTDVEIEEINSTTNDKARSGNA